MSDLDTKDTTVSLFKTIPTASDFNKSFRERGNWSTEDWVRYVKLKIEIMVMEKQKGCELIIRPTDDEDKLWDLVDHLEKNGWGITHKWGYLRFWEDESFPIRNFMFS